MKLTAVVLHNFGQGMFWAYNPDTAEMHHAHNFDIEVDSPEQGANLIWTLTNVGGPDELRLNHPSLAKYADQVREYRTRMNRSLSVGDVIIFSEGERPAGTVAVAMMGFDAIEDPSFTGPATNAGEHSAAYAAHLEVLRNHRTPGGRPLRL